MTMTVKELYEFLEQMMRAEEGKRANWPVCVSFRWKGDTVFSDIISANINGKSIQLNEEDFMHHYRVLNQSGAIE